MSSELSKEQQALAQVMRADAEEANREFWWLLLPSIDRRRALGLAKLDMKRSDDALSTFTIQERARINSALTLHISHMEILLQCTGITVERRPVVDQAGAVARLAELEQKQDETRRRRAEFKRLQEQEQAGRVH